MRILCVGDLHGRDVWKSFGDISLLMKSEGSFLPDYDKYIFLGDYCDSFTLSAAEIIYNLSEVIRFKELYPKNVILLLGNHDVQYMCVKPFAKENPLECSGFMYQNHVDFYELFHQYRDFFKIAWEHDRHLFCHSFVSLKWYKTRFNAVFTEFMDSVGDEGYISMNLADALNISFEYRINSLFDVGHKRGGHRIAGGPLWEDMSRVEDAMPLYHQIVGHTPVNKINTHIIDKHTSVTFIDVLAKKKSFYSLNIKTLKKK